MNAAHGELSAGSVLFTGQSHLFYHVRIGFLLQNRVEKLGGQGVNTDGVEKKCLMVFLLVQQGHAHPLQRLGRDVLEKVRNVEAHAVATDFWHHVND